MRGGQPLQMLHIKKVRGVWRWQCENETTQPQLPHCSDKNCSKKRKCHNMNPFPGRDGSMVWNEAALVASWGCAPAARTQPGAEDVVWIIVIHHDPVMFVQIVLLNGHKSTANVQIPCYFVLSFLHVLRYPGNLLPKEQRQMSLAACPCPVFQP